MRLKADLEPGESLIFEDCLGTSKPMHLAVTDRAIFVTREKHFARESWYLDRIPNPLVTQVSLERERPLVLWGISVLIFLGGLLLYLGIAWNVYRELPGTKTSPWPAAFMILGALMPFLARGRMILNIQVGKKAFRWKPTFVANKTKANQLQQGFVDACRSVGIHIFSPVSASNRKR
jgi:hypothetical protein